MTRRHSRNSDAREMLEEQHSVARPHGTAGRFHLPEWLRPPAREQRQASVFQFLPLYFVVAVLLYLILRTGIEYLLPSTTPKLWGEFLGQAILAVAMIVPALAISRVAGRSFGDFGLPVHQAFGKLFWIGALWGLISLSLLIFVLHAVGGISYGPVFLHGLRVWKFAVFWAGFFLCVALFEEFTFRGYTQFAIQQIAAFWPAALLLSAIFAYIHHSNPGETWWGTLGAGAVGLFFCFTLRRTGNLWFAVGMHASWDWAQSFLYGVPDSGVIEPGHLLQTWLHGPAWLTGGTVGPEGSVLLFPLIALMWFAFDRLFPAKTTSPRRHGDAEEAIESSGNQ